MHGVNDALPALISGLRGVLPREVDWVSLMGLANRNWLTPALFRALHDASLIDGVPGDVADYLLMIHNRNLERNRRLRDQLWEAVARLNRAGVEPVLLKGGADLAVGGDDRLGIRMMSDLDLLVRSGERAAACRSLSEAGYRPLSAARSDGHHQYATLGRGRDVGTVEIHHAVKRFGMLYPPGDAAQGRIVERDGARAVVLSASVRAVHLVLHDMVKEGDYWRGCIDLRHLHDLWRLTRGDDAPDWDRMLGMLPAGAARNALRTQAVTLQRLFGAAVPDEVTRPLLPRAQHWRRMLQTTRPRAGLPFRLAGEAVWMVRQTGSRCRLMWSDQADAVTPLRRVQDKLRSGPGAAVQALIGTDKGPKL